MSGDVIAALVGITASLFLAWRGLQSRRLPFATTATMAAIWVLIIAVVAFAFSRLAG